MLDDILSKDLSEAIRKTEEILSLVNRIYYSENLMFYFRKTAISLLATALSFVLNNLKILRIQYTAQLESKKD